MRKVVVMMLVLFMLMLVVAQADDSSKTPTASPSTPFLPQNNVKHDCYDQCVVQLCTVKQLLPSFYVLCLKTCRLGCTQSPPQTRDAIYDCTVACAESMSTKLDSDSSKVKGDYVEACYNNCKKKY
ncbi:hypothetical protein FCV25MIE_29585 [Fagus crenata]